MSAYTTEILDMKLGGMVCRSCEDVIAAALLAERGVVDADVSYYKSAARVKYDPAIVTPERLEQCVKNAGYGVGGGGLGGAAADAISAAAVILLTWLLTRYAKPGAPVLSAGMSLLQVLLLGMVTSVHCLGMCGGIAMAQGGGIDAGCGAELRAAAAYNLGRVAAYTAVGALWRGDKLRRADEVHGLYACGRGGCAHGHESVRLRSGAAAARGATHAAQTRPAEGRRAAYRGSCDGAYALRLALCDVDVCRWHGLRRPGRGGDAVLRPRHSAHAVSAWRVQGACPAEAEKIRGARVVRARHGDGAENAHRRSEAWELYMKKAVIV